MDNFLLNTEEINRVNNEIHNYISTKKLPFSGLIMGDYDTELAQYIEQNFNEKFVLETIYSFLHSSVISLLPKSSYKFTELILADEKLSTQYKESFGNIYFHQIGNHQMEGYAMKFPSIIQNKDIFLWSIESPVYVSLMEAKKSSLASLELGSELNIVNHALATQMQAYVDTAQELEIMADLKKINSYLFNKSYYASLCFLSTFQETIDNLKHTRPELIEKHRHHVKKRGLSFQKIQHSLENYLSLYDEEKLDITATIFDDVFLQYQNFNFPVINLNQATDILNYCIQENSNLFLQKPEDHYSVMNEPLSYVIKINDATGEYYNVEKNRILVEKLILSMSEAQMTLFRQLIEHYLPQINHESLQKVKAYWYAHLDKVKMDRITPNKVKEQDKILINTNIIINHSSNESNINSTSTTKIKTNTSTKT
jgi:hypothetical protein